MANICKARQEARQAGLKFYVGKPCKRGHDGLRRISGKCVVCEVDDLARYRANNRQRISERTSVRYHSDLEGSRAKSRQAAQRRREAEPRYELVAAAKARAKLKGLDFDLRLDDITIPDTCPVLGIPMESPSLDRVDSTQGYVRGNIRVISWRANKLKSDATLDELRRLVAYVEEHQSSGS